MRHVSLLAGSALLLGACAAGNAPDAARDAERCVFLFDQYDALVDLYPNQALGGFGIGGIAFNPIQQQIAFIRSADCLTRESELDGMEALGENLRPFTPETGGGAIPPVTIMAGIVTSPAAETRAVAFFQSLGYPTRTVGAPQLGRRILVGSFTTQGALDQALAVAREAGFESAYPTRRIRL
jgi:hypothetical protein